MNWDKELDYISNAFIIVSILLFIYLILNKIGV